MPRDLPAARADTEIGTFDPRALERLRWLGNLLDNSIRVPGTNFRFGLDSIIGLVPGVGDLVGGALSLYILVEAARLGVPRSLLTRMGSNVALDVVIGGIPLLGDLFDAGFKANLRNLALLQQHVDRPVAIRSSSRRFVALLAAGVFVFLVAAVAAGVLLVQLLGGAVS